MFPKSSLEGDGIHHSKPLIPVELVQPLIAEWHRRYTYSELSHLTGVPERTFWRIFNEAQWIEFNTLDKILVGMDALHEWQTTFAEYYEMVA